jgi:hypothetical protein
MKKYRKHRRAYRTYCPECHRRFSHRAGVVYCCVRCQDRSWHKRNREKSRAIALACYYRHRKQYVKASSRYKKERQRTDPDYREHRRLAWAAWYARNREHVNAYQRTLYARTKSAPVCQYTRKGKANAK